MLRNADGTVVVRLNASGLPRPPNTVVANWASVERLGNEFELVFGQLVRSEKRLNAALHMTLPCPKMAELLASESIGGAAPFMDLLEAYAGKHVMESYAPEPGVAMPSERCVFERASVAFLAQAEEEAEARFFHLSPADGAVSAGRPLEELRASIKPVVAVMMNTSILWYVCRTCRELLR